MKRYSRALGAILCAAMLAACSGGGAPGTGTSPNGTSMLPSSAAAQARHRGHKRGWIKMKLHVPAKRHRHKGKGAHWLPAATTEIDFTLLAVNGDQNNVNWCNVGQGEGCYDFQIYTTGSNANGCTSDGSGGLECSVNEPAPAASDTYQIQAQYCQGALNSDGTCASPDGLQLLSQSNTTINVPLNGTAQGNFTLNPVVAALQWNASDIEVGSGQPYATGAQPPYPVVQIQALDAYGDVIVGATTDPTGNFNTALYLQWNGSADYVTWNCSDPSVQFETGGGPFSNLPGFTPLSQEVIANGYETDGWDAVHSGKHGIKSHWNQQGFNSPEMNPQNDPSGGMGTDGNGNPVQAVGNNGIEINYDGSTALDLSSDISCTAYDTEGNQASVQVTLGDGTITWTGNSVRAHIQHHH